MELTNKTWYGLNEREYFFIGHSLGGALVPDLDIVPRVYLSGGLKYRVLCEKGIFECHQAKRTLCMLGVVCNKEHLIGDLCSGIFTSKEY